VPDYHVHNRALYSRRRLAAAVITKSPGYRQSLVYMVKGVLNYRAEDQFPIPIMDESDKIGLVFEVPDNCIPVRGLGVEHNH
jgi:hypothetical protein